MAWTPPLDAASSVKIPGYTIIRELGSGGMATVYLARQDRLTRDVALKVMKPIASEGGDFTTRFVFEGQTIAQLQHPQIVTIYDFDSSDGYHYFSMEYLPGGTLSNEIKKGLPVSRAISITKRIAEALAVAHAKGVIHRDVKPQNILFRLDGTPVLTDFGIARAATRDANAMQLTRLGTVIGSPPYMSPEQSTGQPLDRRSDIYSLGIVFYEMLTGKPPYEADNPVTLAWKHCNDPIPPLPLAVGIYQPILEKLLAKKPEDRFANADELIRALEALEDTISSTLVDDEATRILPRPPHPSTTIGEAPQPPPPRFKKRDVLALIAIVAVLGIGGVMLAPLLTDEQSSSILSQLPPAQPDRPETAARYEEIAIQHLLKSEIDSSLRALQLGLAINPDDARLITLKTLVENRAESDKLMDKALALKRENRLAESLEWTRRAIALTPGRAELIALESELEQAIRDQRLQQAETLLTEAQTAVDARQLSNAQRLIEEGLALAPDHEGLAALRAQVDQLIAEAEDLSHALRRITDLVAEDQLDQAEAEIAQALVRHPQNAKLLDLQASVAREIDEHRKQEAASLRDQAEAAINQGDLEQASKLISQGLRLDPGNAELSALEARVARIKEDEVRRKTSELSRRAEEALAAGDAEGALKLALEGLALDPDHAGLAQLRSRSEQAIELVRDIAAILEECAGRFPTAAIRLSTALDAYECYQPALTLDPANQKASAALLALADKVAELIPPLLDRYALDDAEAALSQLRQIAPTHAKLNAFQEDLKRRRSLFPVMVDIRGGCFEMGSPESEAGRELDEQQHRVCVGDFQLGRYEVSVEAFEAFVEATGYKTEAEPVAGTPHGCEALDRSDTNDAWDLRTWATWRKPNKYQDTRPNDPVSCVSWNDALQYIEWLNAETKHRFRLPTEAEWELAARADSTAPRFWGDTNGGKEACDYSNSADKQAGWDAGFPCGDGYEWVAPVGSLKPNPLGIFDMLGNVWEWTCSEYDPSYRGAEQLCAPATSDKPRVMRGGAWNSGPPLVRSAYRNRNFPEASFSFTGFRLAHDKTQ